MKKVISVLFVFALMLLMLCACGENGEQISNTSPMTVAYDDIIGASSLSE